MREWSQFGSTSKYNYNYEAFKSIDSEESAYWLGFLYADGSVDSSNNKLHLSISNKDLLHLEKFRNFIVPDRPIVSTGHPDNSRVIVSSKVIVSDLISKGCIPQKSLTLKRPPEGAIPDNLVRHFIRGYFDGDGCARLVKKGTRVSIDFTGTQDIIEYIVETIKNHTGALCKPKVRKASNYNAYVWANERASDLIKIYAYLYKDATIYLERKESIMSKVFNREVYGD